MQPIYECKESPPSNEWNMVLTILSAGVVPILAILNLGERGRWLLYLYLVMWLLLVILVVVTWRRVWLRVYEDHILIRFGLWYMFRHRIPVESLVSIEDATQWSLIQRGKWANSAFRSLMIHLDSGLLAIDSTKGKFLVPCPDPSDALLTIRKVFKPGVVKIEEAGKLNGYWVQPSSGKDIAAERAAHPWKPRAQQLSDSGLKASSLLYSFVEYSRNANYIGVVITIALIASPAFFDFPFNRGYGLVWPECVWYGIMALAAAFLNRALVPYARIRVYDDRIRVFYGIFWPRRRCMEVGDIESIRVVLFDPSRDFGQMLGITGGRNRWKGWVGVFPTFNNKAVAIDAGDRKLLIALKDPESFSARLREVLGGEDITE